MCVSLHLNEFSPIVFCDYMHTHIYIIHTLTYHSPAILYDYIT